ncbi:hypothetical protein FQZ97_1162230 [compost metagenome]
MRLPSRSKAQPWNLQLIFRVLPHLSYSSSFIRCAHTLWKALISPFLLRTTITEVSQHSRSATK